MKPEQRRCTWRHPRAMLQPFGRSRRPGRTWRPGMKPEQRRCTWRHSWEKLQPFRRSWRPGRTWRSRRSAARRQAILPRTKRSSDYSNINEDGFWGRRRQRAKPTCLGHPLFHDRRQRVKGLESEYLIRISCTNLLPTLSAKRGTYLRWTSTQSKKTLGRYCSLIRTRETIRTR